VAANKQTFFGNKGEKGKEMKKSSNIKRELTCTTSKRKMEGEEEGALYASGMRSEMQSLSMDHI